MALRFKPGSKPKSRDTLLWVIVGALVIWGVWQTISVRRQVLLAMHTKSSSAARTPISKPAIFLDLDVPVVTDTTIKNSITALPDAVVGAQDPASAEIIRVLAPGLLERTHNEIDDARQQLQQGQLLFARHTLQTALRRISGFGESEADTIRNLLMQINDHSILGSAIIPGDPLVKLITVQNGNSLDYLAGLYRITPAMIRRLNPALQPQTLRTGTGVKVILGPLDMHIIIHASRVDVMIRKKFIADYPFRLATPIEPTAGLYQSVRYLPGPLGLNEWILQSQNGSSRLILAGGDIPDVDIRMSPPAMAALHRMVNPEFSRIEVNP